MCFWAFLKMLALPTLYCSHALMCCSGIAIDTAFLQFDLVKLFQHGELQWKGGLCLAVQLAIMIP